MVGVNYIKYDYYIIDQKTVGILEESNNAIQITIFYSLCFVKGKKITIVEEDVILP